jgi:hypothetical protein
MKKLILLLVLAGLAWWYFDYSHRITEAQIRADYAAQVDAIRHFDADRLCTRLADDFSGEASLRQGGRTTQEHFDKDSLCRRIQKTMTLMQRISNATGGLVELEVELEIKSIELSTDHKLATVESVTTTRLGDMTLGRDRTTEHLIRRNLRVLSTGGESNSWAYTPQ